MNTLNQEVLSEDEVKARYPDQWVLVDVLEWDAQLIIARGIVRGSGEDKEALYEMARQLPRLTERRKISIFYTGEWLKDQVYLLNYDLSL